MINKQKIMDVIGCDEDFLKELLDKFVSECTESNERLNNALKSQDWPSVKGSAHKMLSSTRIFEMDDLTSLLKKIEILAGEEKELEKIDPLVQKLNVKLEDSFHEIKTMS